jgi:hypothetical protein
MDNPLDINEEPRALRFPDRAPEPASVLVEQMRRDSRWMSALLADVASHHFELEQAFAEASRDLAGDTSNAWKAVSMVVDGLGEVLSNHHIATEDPIGRTWRDQMRSEYDLVGFANREDIETPTVAHVVSPLIRRFGRMIRKGKVTVNAPAMPSGHGADDQ